MNLNFFTAKFPFYGGEAIVENELPIVSEYFDSVKIFPHIFTNQNESRKVEKNCTIHQLGNFNDVKLSFSYKKLLFYFFCIELIRNKNLKYYLLNFKKWLSLLKIAAKKAQFIEDNDLLLKDAVNYSYWMNDWTLVLVFLKKRKFISNFVFRCGGFDIWDERHEGNYLPFRYLIYKYANFGYPNAKIAADYMKKKTPFGSKIKVGYLGTNDYDVGKFNDGNIFTIVSVSNAIPLKRVHLIVELLKGVNPTIKWIHFGDGKELNNIKTIAKAELKQHQIEFKGMVDNSDIINFYKTNSVNLFVTTSVTESLPVSIQEAISFGIPILATDVGGMSEIVNTKTGILIPANFNTKEVSEQLNSYIESNYFNTKLRESTRQFWEENFNAKEVYLKFGKELKQLFEAR